MDEQNDKLIQTAIVPVTTQQYIAAQIEWVKDQYLLAPTGDVKERCLDVIASLAALLVDLASK